MRVMDGNLYVTKPLLARTNAGQGTVSQVPARTARWKANGRLKRRQVPAGARRDDRVHRRTDRSGTSPGPLAAELSQRGFSEDLTDSREGVPDHVLKDVEHQHTIVEDWGSFNEQHGTFKYDRDAESGVVSALTITCPVRNGPPAQHTRKVGEDDLPVTKIHLEQACFPQEP